MPGWHLTIYGGAHLVSAMGAEPIVVEGDGPMPILLSVPLPPPVVFVPPEPPPTGLPFVWPPQPGFTPEDPAERYFGLGQGFYAALPTYQNPLPASNMYAGEVAPGVTFEGRAIGGLRLWAPHDAPGDTIRRVLAIGRP